MNRKPLPLNTPSRVATSSFLSCSEFRGCRGVESVCKYLGPRGQQSRVDLARPKKKQIFRNGLGSPSSAGRLLAGEVHAGIQSGAHATLARSEPGPVAKLTFESEILASSSDTNP